MALEPLLKTYGQIGVQVLKQAIASVRATGRTERSIRYDILDGKKLVFYVRAFFELLQKGINPSGKNPSPQMIKSLTEYAKARGMDKPKNAAWAIAKTILEEGDKTHKKHGRDLWSDDIRRFNEEFKKALKEERKKTYQEEISRKLNAMISKEAGTYHEGQYIK